MAMQLRMGKKSDARIRPGIVNKFQMATILKNKNSLLRSFFSKIRTRDMFLILP